MYDSKFADNTMSELRKYFSGIESLLADPQALMEQVEACLPNFLHPSIYSAFITYCNNTGCLAQEIAPYLVAVNDHRYEFCYGHATTTFILTINSCLNSTSSDPKRLKFPINGNGRFREIEYQFEPELEEFINGVHGDIVGSIELIYRWLTETLNRFLNAIQADVAESLYSYLRVILPEAISSRVWFYIVAQNRGLYILDSIARRQVLATAHKSRAFLTRSPLEMQLDFLTTLVPAKSTYSAASAEIGHAIQGEFISPRYAETGIQLAEIAIYEDEGNVVQALMAENDVILAAGYPRDIQEHVEDILIKNRRHFHEIVTTGKIECERIIAFLNSQKLDSPLSAKLENWVSLTGTFLGGFVREYSRG